MKVLGHRSGAAASFILIPPASGALRISRGPRGRFPRGSSPFLARAMLQPAGLSILVPGQPHGPPALSLGSRALQKGSKVLLSMPRVLTWEGQWPGTASPTLKLRVGRGCRGRQDSAAQGHPCQGPSPSPMAHACPHRETEAGWPRQENHYKLKASRGYKSRPCLENSGSQSVTGAFQVP